MDIGCSCNNGEELKSKNINDMRHCDISSNETGIVPKFRKTGIIKNTPVCYHH